MRGMSGIKGMAKKCQLRYLFGDLKAPRHSAREAEQYCLLLPSLKLNPPVSGSVGFCSPSTCLDIIQAPADPWAFLLRAKQKPSTDFRGLCFASSTSASTGEERTLTTHTHTN